MTDTRAPRPTDLVALVTFDEEVRENLAITRDHLGVPNEPPRPLAAALEQWLHLGRRMWISLGGRSIQGIATARELSRTAWEIDTLIDAPEGDRNHHQPDGQHPDREHEVIADLLRQAGSAARDAGVTRVLLRTPTDSPAVEVAPRAGFRPVVEETLWLGSLMTPVDAEGELPADARVREAEDADRYPRFQLYSRAYPVTAREALAMTLEEWEALEDHRWVDRGAPPTLVEESEGRIRACLRASSRSQFELMSDPEAPGAGTALLQELRRRRPEAEDAYGLVVSGSAAEESARRAGLQPAGTYALFCLRVSQPIREEVREGATARTGIAIPGS